jgi:uncharacterized membrane protein
MQDIAITGHEQKRHTRSSSTRQIDFCSLAHVFFYGPRHSGARRHYCLGHDLVYNPDKYLPFKVPGTGLVFSLLVITIVGFLGANFVGRKIIGWWDGLVNRTPVVRSIYKGSKQIFETMFSEKGASFQKVCLVEWPRRDAWSIAFVSREIQSEQIGLKPGQKMYAVYVSTTPNPTSGYVFFVAESEVKILDMTVEDGLKLVISMGLVFPEAPLPEAQELKIANAKSTRRSKA